MYKPDFFVQHNNKTEYKQLLYQMKIRLSALLAIAFIMGVSACKKTNNDAPTIVSQVGLNVVNASADTFNVYLNGSRLNTTSTILPGYSTGYYAVPKGQQSYQIKKPFNTVTNTIQTLFSITVPVDNNLNHSLFVTDGTAANAFSTVDNFQADTIDKTCLIRFVNSSPGSGGLDMSYADTTRFSNIPFKTAGNFTSVSTVNGASASGLIPLKIFNNGSTTPLLIDSVALSEKRSCTVYTLGKPGDTGFTIVIRTD